MVIDAQDGSELVIDYGAMRALVVDDIPSMRSAFKTTLSNFGITRIEVAGSAQEAIFKLKNAQFDLIISDYNLGEGRDGQQLLEELRHRGLMTLDTVFIMVTAESKYEKVVATAELAPDDYMIKPFSAEVLCSRLEVIVRRKRAFADIYAHYHKGELEAAVAGCDAVIASKPRYVVDALRFKGELQNAMARYEEAEVLYRQVVAMRAVPWARLGLARSLHMQHKEAEAEQLLNDVLEKTPELVAAYDLLAEVRLANKDSKGAQQALEQGTAISSRTVHRQQKLGELAYENADLDTARNAYSAALEKGRHSIFVGHADYANLCRVQVEQGDLDGALGTLKKGRATLQGSPEGQLASAVMESVIHTKAGRTDAARKALDEAAKLRGAGVRGDEKVMLDMAGAYMVQGRQEECDAIVGEVAKNAHDSETLLTKARKIYEEAGHGDQGSDVLTQATEKVRKLNNEGAMLAQKGRLREAMETLLQAAAEAPYNPRIAMNAAWATLGCIERENPDNKRDLFAQVRDLLDRAESLSPDHPRLPGLRSKMREVVHMFSGRR